MTSRLRHWGLALLALPMMFGFGGCHSNDETNSELTEWRQYTPPAPEGVITPAGPASEEVHRLPTFIKRRPLREIFNDSNELQLQGARHYGFSPIGRDLRSAWVLSRPVVKIASCKAYAVDTLTMSMPYLVPRAAKLLEEIGLAFSDTVRARGGREYRIRVTSLTRSDFTVARLKRRNRAATEESCHRFGTTFDISWTRFDCRDSSCGVSLEDLKNILAEVIMQQREQGKCYAIFERRQGCFHLTVK